MKPVWVCLCVCEREEGDREKKRQRERERGTNKQTARKRQIKREIWERQTEREKKVQC